MAQKFALLLLLASLCGLSAQAQRKGDLRAGLEFGYVLPPKGYGGLAASAELKYNLQDNMNIGARWTTAWMPMQVDSYKSNMAANSGYLLTYDYYCHRPNTRLAPFVGGGAGLFVIDALYLSPQGVSTKVSNTEYKPIAMVRAGVEYARFRLNVEYNFIPNSHLSFTLPEQLATQHTLQNHYFGVNLGIFLGSGAWHSTPPATP